MTALVQVVLPAGPAAADGAPREAELRPLTGSDELLVHQAVAAGVPRVAITTDLLGGCLRGAGRAAADLCVGERQALLLHLRRSAFGERIEAVAHCPQCREKIDLELRTSDLLRPLKPGGSAQFEAAVEADGTRWRAQLRRVTGADLHAALAAADPARALLQRCVASLVRDDGADIPVEAVPEALARALDEALRRSDPMAEIDLDVACPVCTHAFVVHFDPAAQLFAELAVEADLLLREVGAVARAFHWREQDILAMPRTRRRAYAAMAAGP